jgi:hypothetical protein
MADIFISYAREDKETAQLLADALEQHGLTVFWDRRIPAGKRFDDYIGEQLQTARCVIVVWSPVSVHSSWVREEAAEGRDRRILVPVRLKDIAPPLGFRAIQAANLIDWQGEPSHWGFKQLLEDVRLIIEVPVHAAVGDDVAEAEAQRKAAEERKYQPEADTRTSTGDKQAKPRSSSKLWLVAAVAIVCLVGASYIAYYNRQAAEQSNMTAQNNPKMSDDVQGLRSTVKAVPTGVLFLIDRAFLSTTIPETLTKAINDACNKVSERNFGSDFSIGFMIYGTNTNDPTTTFGSFADGPLISCEAYVKRKTDKTAGALKVFPGIIEKDFYDAFLKAIQLDWNNYGARYVVVIALTDEQNFATYFNPNTITVEGLRQLAIENRIAIYIFHEQNEKDKFAQEYFRKLSKYPNIGELYSDDTLQVPRVIDALSHQVIAGVRY